MKKIIIVKTVEITLGAECDKLSDTQLINDIQGLYDNYGIVRYLLSLQI